MQETTVRDALVQRAKEGDPAAISELYEVHAPRLYRYFLPRVSGHTHVAEDLTEEVFVRVLERFQQYEDRGLPFGAWLFRIAHNLLIDQRRRLPRQPHVGLDECEELDSPAAINSLDQALDHHELVRAMARLTAEQQRVIRLRFLEGVSIADTASTMCKTEESVKKLQARALHAMRRTLMEPVPPVAPVRELPREAEADPSDRFPTGAEQLAILLAAAITRMRGQM